MVNLLGPLTTFVFVSGFESSRLIQVVNASLIVSKVELNRTEIQGFHSLFLRRDTQIVGSELLACELLIKRVRFMMISAPTRSGQALDDWFFTVGISASESSL